jgi:hypothetical protein
MCNRELTILEEQNLLSTLDEVAWQKTLHDYAEHEQYIGRTVLGIRKIIEIYVKHLHAATPPTEGQKL